MAEDVTANVGHIPNISTKVGFSLIIPLYNLSTFLFMLNYLPVRPSENIPVKH